MPRHVSFAVIVVAWLVASSTVTAQSQEVQKPLAISDSTEANSDASSPKSRLNVPMKTLGGREFWGDVVHFHDWRIQQNVFTKHYRLIDGSDTRRAWGTREQCQAALDEVKREQRLPRMSGTGVILIHGITRSSKSMSAFREPLTKAGYHVFPFDYPSTRVEIPESADYLKQVIESLEGIETLHIIAHSMGGIVTRAYMSQPNPDPRIKRLVMIGSPNSGAELADLLSDNMNFVFKPMLGPAGQQLVTDSDGLIARLPTPTCDFAVIAGGRGGNGFNPLIPDDDDGIVSVASTRLPGAADFMQIPSLHLRLLRAPEAISSAIRFLETGKLRNQGDPQPIPRNH